MSVADPETRERTPIKNEIYSADLYLSSEPFMSLPPYWRTVNIIDYRSLKLDMDSLDRTSDTDICVSVKSSMWQNIPSENKKDMVFQNIHLSICVNVWVVKMLLIVHEVYFCQP